MHPRRVGERGSVLICPPGLGLTDQFFIHMREQHRDKVEHRAILW